MPFRSEAERKWMHANKPELAEKFEAETPKDANLPERVNPRKPPKDIYTRNSHGRIY